MRTITILSLLIALAIAPPAMADSASGVVTQAGGPLIVTQGPTLSQEGMLLPVYATASGSVRSSGAATVEACALYLKVWRNHTLIANTSANCVRGARGVSFTRSWDSLAWSGGRATAQTWFDVRYRLPGQAAVTHRFTSPRAVIPVY